MTDTRIKDAVREKYGQAARRVGSGSCCGGAALERADPIASNLDTDHQTGDLPDTAVLASLGCGNPAALAELKPGKTVLDLGSGGGKPEWPCWQPADLPIANRLPAPADDFIL